MILGTVGAIETTRGLSLIIDGETAPTTKEYYYLASYAPVTGDRVLIEEINGTYIVIGKITNSVQDSAARWVKGLSTSKDGIQVNYVDGTQSAAAAVVQANSVWNRSHTDHTYPIVFMESGNVFYIAYSGGTWKRITTS
jgi:hypothetical protein